MESNAPTNPGECSSGKALGKPSDGDYYVQISVQALLAKHSG